MTAMIAATQRNLHLSEVRPVRSLSLLALGAVAGLAIAGFGLFTAKGTSTRTVPPDCVALVNQRPILKIDFISQLRTVYGVGLEDSTAEQRQKILSDMVREELFVQRGLELDFPASDPDTRTALVAAVEQQVVADVAAAQPSEADLSTYYEAHKAKYSSDGTMVVHDLVSPTADATATRAAAEAVRSGTPLAEVAARYGFKDSDKTNGEEFYLAVQAHLGDALYKVALPLGDGQVSDPISTPEGTHLLMMTHNVRPVALGFDKAREQVANDYRREAAAKVERRDEVYLRDKADILVAPEYR
jgi:parvulin-like peptidyl-prolyl isomerase